MNFDILKLVSRQLETLFLLEEYEALESILPAAVQRTEKCIAGVGKQTGVGTKYFTGEIKPFHTGHYCIFLYYLSNEAAKNGHTLLADKIYALNKALHAVDIFHQVKLPDVFHCEHPVGSVIGRADYSNGFYFAQNCTVGNNKDSYPKIGENVKMLAGSMIIGKCNIGNNVTIAARAYIKDQDVPDNTIVFGSSPDLVFKPLKA